MGRLLEATEVLLLNGWVVALVDGVLGCLGLTWTMASIAPSLRTALERRERALASRRLNRR